jgi:hypothetical protein
LAGKARQKHPTPHVIEKILRFSIWAGSSISEARVVLESLARVVVAPFE